MSDPTELNAPEFAVTCGLRWSDFDRLGHLNQAVYHVLMEQARTEYLSSVRPDGLPRHLAYVMARVELDYRREVDASHEAVVATLRPLTLGASSLVAEQQIRWIDGAVAATGSIVLVAFDAKARAKRAFSDGERALITG